MCFPGCSRIEFFQRTMSRFICFLFSVCGKKFWFIFSCFLLNHLGQWLLFLFSFLFLTEDCLCLFRRWMGWPRASETGCFSHIYAQLHHAELDRCQTGLASVGPKNETRRQRHGVVDIDTIKSVVGEKRLDKLRTKGGRKMIWSAPPM